MKRALAIIIILMFVVITGRGQGRLQFTPAKGWVAETSSSSMRVGQFKLPKVGDDPEDASLIVYFFGGGGGSVQANLDRWIGQMAQPDGKPSKDLAKITNSTVNNLKITVLDVSGTYQAEVSPGAGQRFNKSNYRMLASVIETPGGPYFIKLVGPARTVEKWRPSFDAFVNSLQYK